MKKNPKKNKEDRRKRNPLPLIGISPDGRKNGYFKVIKKEGVGKPEEI